jgi:hypothetical protein
MITPIQSLLARYAFKPTERMLREAVAATVTQQAGIRISEQQVRLQGDTVFLNVRPMERSEIMMHHVAILEAFRTNELTKYVRMIR